MFRDLDIDKRERLSFLENRGKDYVRVMSDINREEPPISFLQFLR